MNGAPGLTLAERTDGTGMPLYVQLHSLMIKRLEAGDWAKGQQLPTLEELMAEYGVSRATVREAMTRLEREGIVSRSRGRGTHVTKDLTQERWLLMPNTWDELVVHIDTLHAGIKETRSGFGKLARTDHRGELAEEYWLSQRVNQLETGAPYSVSDISLAREIFDTNPEGYGSKPVLPLLASDSRVKLAEAYQSLTISTADLQAAHWLGLEVGAPVAQVRREAIDANGKLIYLAEIVYPARYLRIDSRLI